MTARAIEARVRVLVRALLAILTVLTLGGCVSVAPYEREHLASPAMNTELEESEMDFQSHVFDAREGATGGHGSTGGGCGCN